MCKLYNVLVHTYPGSTMLSATLSYREVRGRELTVRDISESDGGIYLCHVELDCTYGDVRSVLALYVQ